MGSSTGPEPIRSRRGLFIPEEQAEFSKKKSFVLAMQRLLASARSLASDGSSASIDEPLHEAGEDHATIRNVFGSPESEVWGFSTASQKRPDERTSFESLSSMSLKRAF